MFSNHNNRSFFYDLASAVKLCCEKHNIPLRDLTEEFDDFLDELDTIVVNFLDEVKDEINDKSEHKED